MDCSLLFLCVLFWYKEKISGSQIISQGEGSTEHSLEIIRNCQTAHRRLCGLEVFKLIYYSVLNLKDNWWSSVYTWKNAADFLFGGKEKTGFSFEQHSQASKQSQGIALPSAKKYTGNSYPVTPGVVTEAGNPFLKEERF